VKGSEVRVGMVISLSSVLCQVTKSQMVKPGKGGAYNNLELAEVRRGRKRAVRLRSDEKVETATLGNPVLHTVLYEEGDVVHVMNAETFEQLELGKDLVAEAARPFLMDGSDISLQSIDGEVAVASLPKSVAVRVAHTDEMSKTATKDAVFKPATLENGLTVMVPQFIQTDSVIDVNPNDGTYVGKSS
jgi:elongation factor P